MNNVPAAVLAEFTAQLDEYLDGYRRGLSQHFGLAKGWEDVPRDQKGRWEDTGGGVVAAGSAAPSSLPEVTRDPTEIGKAAPRGTPRYKVLDAPRVDEALIARAERDMAAVLSKAFRAVAREIAKQVAPALAKSDDDFEDEPVLAGVDSFSDPRIADAVNRLQQMRRQPPSPERDEAIETLQDDLFTLVEEALEEVTTNGFSSIMQPSADTMQAVTESGGHEALLTVGLNDEPSIVDQVNEDALSFATERAAELVGKTWDDDAEEFVDNPDAEWSIDESTRGMIASDVTTAIEEGWSTDQLKDQLLGNYAFSEARAEMIARTEINRANNFGNMIGYRRSQVVQQKIWLAGNENPDGLGDQPCDECQSNADAGPIDLNDIFPTGDDAPPAHPHCRCAVAPVVIDEVTGEETEDDDDAEESDDD